MDVEHYQCDSCDRSVPESNRTMHSLVCERGISRQSAPRESVAETTTVAPTVSEIGARASHVDEAVDVDVERTEQDTETQPSSARTPSAPEVQPSESLLVECEFCDLPVRMQNLEEHSTQCGSRTDVCELCLNYVRLRDMRPHKDSGCSVASTGSAMRSALDEGYENDPLLGNPPGQMRVRAERSEMSSWTPVAVAVGAVAAAAAMSLLVRRH